MLKKILSLLLIVSFVSFSSVSASAETVTPAKVNWSYLIFDSNGELIEEGSIPNSMLRYTWSGATLYNGQTVRFVPSHNYNGFYCLKGVSVSFGFNYSFLSGKAGTLLTRFYRAGGYTDIKYTYTSPTSSHSFGGFTTPTDGYVYFDVTNYSSDSVKISNVYLQF